MKYTSHMILSLIFEEGIIFPTHILYNTDFRVHDNPQLISKTHYTLDSEFLLLLNELDDGFHRGGGNFHLYVYVVNEIPLQSHKFHQCNYTFLPL